MHQETFTLITGILYYFRPCGVCRSICEGAAGSGQEEVEEKEDIY